MDNSLEQKISDLYLANIDIIGEGLPAQVNSQRAGYLESLLLVGIPDSKQERYRHSDLRRLLELEREYYFTPGSRAEPLERMPGDVYRIDLVNGFCHSGLTRGQDGIVYGSLREAMQLCPDLVLKYYNKAADNDGESITALNSVFMQDGAFVFVPEGVQVEKPVMLSFDYLPHEAGQMCFSRALIVLQKNAKAEVVIAARSSAYADIFVDYVRETIVGEGASLRLTEISDMGSRSAIVASNYLDQDKSSHTDATNVWFGAGMTRVNALTRLMGSGSEAELRGMYFGTGEQSTDINMTVEHRVPDCTSFELIKGVVSDRATGSFTGRVVVAQDAQRTVALQQSRNLQLSDQAKIYTEPQLEIYADDVKCSHGATVGQMDDGAIFYMRQRGISEQDARRLQLAGFVNDVVGRCSGGEICGYVQQLAEKRITEL